MPLPSPLNRCPHCGRVGQPESATYRVHAEGPRRIDWSRPPLVHCAACHRRYVLTVENVREAVRGHPCFHCVLWREKFTGWM